MGPGITRHTFEALSTDDKLKVMYDLICSLEKRLEQLHICVRRGYVSPWQVKVLVGLTSVLASLTGVIVTKIFNIF